MGGLDARGRRHFEIYDMKIFTELCLTHWKISINVPSWTYLPEMELTWKITWATQTSSCQKFVVLLKGAGIIALSPGYNTH
jgi:hypothetical protein